MMTANKITQAIAKLKAERFAIGEAVTDTTIAILEEKLAALQTTREMPTGGSSWAQQQRGAESVGTPFVGRSIEMQRLQEGVHRALKAGTGSAYEIRGDVGVGKTRLVREFVDWTRSIADDILVLRGRGNPEAGEHASALIGDILGAYFGIQDSDEAVVIEEKLAKGWAAEMSPQNGHAQIQLQLIGTLFGLNPPGIELWEDAQLEASKVGEGVTAAVVNLIEGLTNAHRVLILVFEDAQWADNESLDLAECLTPVCDRAPLLLVRLVRSRPKSDLRLSGRQPSDHESGSSELAFMTLDLNPLTDEESRQLIAGRTRQLPALPHDARNSVVAFCGGNPLVLESLISILIDDGTVRDGEFKWQMEPDDYRQLRGPDALGSVLRTRLDHLLPAEKMTLQRAAVLGNVFWPGAVHQIAQTDGKYLTLAETEEALQSLARKGLVSTQEFSQYANAAAYTFESTALREAVYQSVLSRKLPGYHRQAANWLAKSSRKISAGRSALIANHYAKANEHLFAAELFELAATQARETYDLSLALDCACQALAVLIEVHQHASWQLKLQEMMAELLCQQARFVEAAQTYLTMEYIAVEDGDLMAQVRALNGLARIQREQGAYEVMMHNAEQAEQVARLAGAEEELTIALLSRGEAQLLLRDPASAATSASQALDYGRARQQEPQITRSLCLLFAIYENSEDAAEAGHCLKQLVQRVRRLEAATTFGNYQGHEIPPAVDQAAELTASAKVALGKVYQALGRYDQAQAQFDGALRWFRSYRSGMATACTFDLLGETARLSGDTSGAVPLHRRAVAVATLMGDERNALRYRAGLGEALIAAGDFTAAVAELDQVIRCAEDPTRMANWTGLPLAHCLKARAHSGLRQPEKALDAAQRGYGAAQSAQEPADRAVAWRTLGEVAAMPGQAAVIIVDGADKSATDCFGESLHILRQLKGKSASAYRARLETLLAWSEYEQRQGKQERAAALAAEIRVLEGERVAWLKSLGEGGM